MSAAMAAAESFGAVEMAWDRSQREVIFAAVWAGGAASCPTDGAALRVGWGPAMGGSYALAIHCPTCGTDVRMGKADDPLGASLRRWTEAERQKLVEEAHGDAPVTCPVDGAAIRPHVLAGGGVSLSCMRCGNEHQGG